MADKLTVQQEQAVTDRGGMLLVSAAAGSGKTKVLVDRLMGYLTDADDPANLDEFLIITYTKAAASELRGKIAAKLTQLIAEHPENKHLQNQMQRLFLTKISTVHGFCTDILREYAYRMDLSADFRVADENECRELRETVMQDLLDSAYDHADATFHAFLDTQGLGRDDRAVPEIVQKVYDSSRCHLDPEQWLDSCLIAGSLSGVTDASETQWGQYLIDELKAYLSCQIAVMEQCIREASRSDGLEKQVANLNTTLRSMKTLYEARSWDDIAANRSVEFPRLVFPRKPEDPELVERIKAARTACKKGLDKRLAWFTDPSRQVLEDLAQCAAGTQGLILLVRAFDKAYSAAKKSRKVLDFSDLEHLTLTLLLGKNRSNPTAAATEIGARYREIMVDEYQDSNGVQDAIFSVLSQKKHNCFMVGDVKQSIYQFRLADPGIFLKKYQTYLPVENAKPGQERKILLSHNFRSGGEVIEAVNHVFSSCMSPHVGGLHYGEEESLKEGIAHKPLPDTAVELHTIEVRESTYAEEAAFVASRIETMLADGTCVRDGDGVRPVTADDIVILLRSPGSVGIHFERALTSRGIRCASGGGNDLLKTPEIATLRAILQAVYNPRQDIPLIAALASPVFGFTADDLASIRSRQKKGNVYEALLQSDMPKVKTFLDILSSLRRQARMNTLTQLIESCMILTRMDSIYAAMDGGEMRRENLKAFFSLAAEFATGSNRGLGQFLEYLDALEEKGLTSSGGAVNGCVTIMSIHKSKGLEFPVVILAGLSREFNRDATRAAILCDRELGIGMCVVDHKTRVRYPSIAKRAITAKMITQSISEEMRVLYVAMTRARDRLIMTYAAQNLQSHLQQIALRRDFDGGELICREVVCPGEWVLKAAMERTEAGELFALGGKPKQTSISDFPWKITVTDAPTEETDKIVPDSGEKPELTDETVEILRTALAFRYSHTAATQAPSKQTATQRKGREKDEEVSEDTEEPKTHKRNWRKPSFARASSAGKDYGSAIHAVMQYIRYELCGDAGSVASEVERLSKGGFLDPEMAKNVNCEQIASFFQTDIGKKLRSGVRHVREFKFSILDDGRNYGASLEGEQVLLQGVVDCALLEDDGITILDFKTDHVTEETIDSVSERYRMQVETYADAMARIYEMPVRRKWLYFFHLGRFVAM